MKRNKDQYLLEQAYEAIYNNTPSNYFRFLKTIQEKNNHHITNNRERSDDITIYCDMDGVLANFKLGVSKYVPNFENQWDKLPVDFFLHLKQLPGASKLMSFIRSKFKNVYILSAAPKKHRGKISSRAVIDKRKWLETHFKFNPNNIIIGTREEKQQYAKNNKNNILIDDLRQNIDEWEVKGGTGILYTDANVAINQLNAYIN